jgi:hypothetical protein
VIPLPPNRSKKEREANKQLGRSGGEDRILPQILSKLISFCTAQFSLSLTSQFHTLDAVNSRPNKSAKQEWTENLHTPVENWRNSVGLAKDCKRIWLKFVAKDYEKICLNSKSEILGVLLHNESTKPLVRTPNFGDMFSFLFLCVSSAVVSRRRRGCSTFFRTLIFLRVLRFVLVPDEIVGNKTLVDKTQHGSERPAKDSSSKQKKK